jgi:hypothetical protein
LQERIETVGQDAMPTATYELSPEGILTLTPCPPLKRTQNAPASIASRGSRQRSRSQIANLPWYRNSAAGPPTTADLTLLSGRRHPDK